MLLSASLCRSQQVEAVASTRVHDDKHHALSQRLSVNNSVTCAPLASSTSSWRHCAMQRWSRSDRAVVEGEHVWLILSA